MLDQVHYRPQTLLLVGLLNCPKKDVFAVSVVDVGEGGGVRVSEDAAGKLPLSVPDDVLAHLLEEGLGRLHRAN